MWGPVGASSAIGPGEREHWRHAGAPHSRLWVLVAVGLTTVVCAAFPRVALAMSCPNGWTVINGTQCSLSIQAPGTYPVTVPSGVHTLQVIASGGPGGGIPNGTPGGLGGADGGFLAVTPGEELTAVAGGAGGSPTGLTGGSGGYGGGGPGGAGTVSLPGNICGGPNCNGTGGGGGGGGSFVYGPTGLLVAAPGGGGSTVSEDGGSGNGGTGGCAVHVSGNAGMCGGQPGTSTGGGAGGTPGSPSEPPTVGMGAGNGTAGAGPASSSGGPGKGGSGGTSTNFTLNGSTYSGLSGAGGGGGGFYGGGGGASGGLSETAGGGGGGSGYLDPSLTNTTSVPIPLGSGVEFRYTPTSVIVNSTHTGTDPTEAQKGVCDITPSASTPTCTLPQAILTSNDTTGKAIAFDIPTGSGNAFDAGVPQIDLSGTSLPAIKAPTEIDGTSQPSAGRVEVSGEVNEATILDGLVVGSGGGGSTIKGLVINGFQEMIVLQAGSDTIVDNWLGTNAAGEVADAAPLGPAEDPSLPVSQIGVRIDSTGNQIGGPGTGQGNVIASGYTPRVPNGAVENYHLEGAGLIDDTRGGNVLEGNRLGVAAGSSAPLIGSPPSALSGPSVVPALSLSGAADTVGGNSSGKGNTIAGGGTIASRGTVLQGNTITDGGLIEPTDGAAGEDALTVSGAVTVGGPTTTPGEGDGNTFVTRDDTGTNLLTITGDGAVVQGNLIEGDPGGGILDKGSNVTIGGRSGFGVGNRFKDNGATLGPEQEPPAAHVAAVTVVDESLSNPNTLIAHNSFEHNGGAGAVDLEVGFGVTVTENSMLGNSQAVTYQAIYYYDGQRFAGSGAPNDLQPYPRIWSAERSGGTSLTGSVPQPQNYHGGHYTIELYGQPSCAQDSITPGQGETWLGGQPLRPNGLGDLAMTFPATPAGEDAVSATITAPNGSTSEFSPCLTLGHRAESFPASAVTATSSTITVAPSPSTTADLAAAGPQLQTRSVAQERSAKVTTAHGTLRLFCPPITTGGCTGSFRLTFPERHPAAIAHGRFTLAPGEVEPIKITLTGTRLTQLQRAHRMRVVLTTNAHDRARHRHHRTVHARLTLAYS